MESISWGSKDRQGNWEETLVLNDQMSSGFGFPLRALLRLRGMNHVRWKSDQCTVLSVIALSYSHTTERVQS